MDERLRRKMLAFYVAGVINILLGLYVLIAGPGFLPQNTVFWLTLFFFGFAAVDFWFPRMLRKRWEEMLAKHTDQQKAGAAKAPAGAAGGRDSGKS